MALAPLPSGELGRQVAVCQIVALSSSTTAQSGGDRWPAAQKTAPIGLTFRCGLFNSRGVIHHSTVSTDEARGEILPQWPMGTTGGTELAKESNAQISSSVKNRYFINRFPVAGDVQPRLSVCAIWQRLR